MRRLALALLVLATLSETAHAQSLELHGYGDFRTALPSDEQDWGDGGLGKSRFGDDADIVVSASAVLAATWQITPELLAVSQVQYQPEQRRRLDVVDAYLRYRPVSTTPWRWSTKLGAFFPPISLENDGMGWTSPWTLTSSAINSWVGEELRTFGAELRVEHRADTSTIQAMAAVFGKNDPAGELLASRGWALGDLTSGLNASLREPDAFAPAARAPVPVLFRPFDEIDHRVGWYAGLDWSAPGYGKVTVLRYDNRADPSSYARYAGRKVFAWHTRFWSLGAQARRGDVVLIGQVMRGATAFEPQRGLVLDTQLRAGYLLAGWDRGAWRPALRVDLFSLRQLPGYLPAPLSEHGHAVTLALNWRPRDNLRVTGEWLRIASKRDQRLLAGLSPHQVDTQVQASVRVLF